jgi:hypothetical protein
VARMSSTALLYSVLAGCCRHFMTTLRIVDVHDMHSRRLWTSRFVVRLAGKFLNCNLSLSTRLSRSQYASGNVQLHALTQCVNATAADITRTCKAFISSK